MRHEIRSQGFTLTDGIRIHTERQLGFALDRFRNQVRTVVVRVRDVNGHKGGIDDKCCQIAVHLKHGDILLEERAGDLYVAIDNAVHMVRQAVARDVERIRKRKPLRRRVADEDELHGTAQIQNDVQAPSPTI